MVAVAFVFLFAAVSGFGLFPHLIHSVNKLGGVVLYYPHARSYNAEFLARCAGDAGECKHSDAYATQHNTTATSLAASSPSYANAATEPALPHIGTIRLDSPLPELVAETGAADQTTDRTQEKTVVNPTTAISPLAGLLELSSLPETTKTPQKAGCSLKYPRTCPLLRILSWKFVAQMYLVGISVSLVTWVGVLCRPVWDTNESLNITPVSEEEQVITSTSEEGQSVTPAGEGRRSINITLVNEEGQTIATASKEEQGTTLTNEEQQILTSASKGGQGITLTSEEGQSITLAREGQQGITLTSEEEQINTPASNGERDITLTSEEGQIIAPVSEGEQGITLASGEKQPKREERKDPILLIITPFMPTPTTTPPSSPRMDSSGAPSCFDCPGASPCLDFLDAHPCLDCAEAPLFESFDAPSCLDSYNERLDCPDGSCSNDHIFPVSPSFLDCEDPPYLDLPDDPPYFGCPDTSLCLSSFEDLPCIDSSQDITSPPVVNVAMPAVPDSRLHSQFTAEFEQPTIRAYVPPHRRASEVMEAMPTPSIHSPEIRETEEYEKWSSSPFASRSVRYDKPRPRSRHEQYIVYSNFLDTLPDRTDDVICGPFNGSAADQDMDWRQRDPSKLPSYSTRFTPVCTTDSSAGFLPEETSSPRAGFNVKPDGGKKRWPQSVLSSSHRDPLTPTRPRREASLSSPCSPTKDGSEKKSDPFNKESVYNTGRHDPDVTLLDSVPAAMYNPELAWIERYWMVG